MKTSGYYYERGLFWFRIFGYGLLFKDLSKSEYVLFSDRCYYRGYEIDYWIKKNCNKSYVSFVIIDDDCDMASLKNQHFRTMPDMGIQKHHYDSILLRMRDKFPICEREK